MSFAGGITCPQASQTCCDKCTCHGFEKMLCLTMAVNPGIDDVHKYLFYSVMHLSLSICKYVRLPMFTSQPYFDNFFPYVIDFHRSSEKIIDGIGTWPVPKQSAAYFALNWFLNYCSLSLKVDVREN